MTKNFSISEFDCKSGAKMPASVRKNIERLAKNLQFLRDELGAPIEITSGYRSPAHNKKIGGAANSRHVVGDAADVPTCTDRHSAGAVEVDPCAAGIYRSRPRCIELCQS